MQPILREQRNHRFSSYSWCKTGGFFLFFTRVRLPNATNGLRGSVRDSSYDFKSLGLVRVGNIEKHIPVSLKFRKYVLYGRVFVNKEKKVEVFPETV